MRVFILTLASLLAATAPAAGQEPAPAPAPPPAGWAFGVSGGQFFADHERYLETTLHVTRLKAGTLTPAFSLGLFPQVLAENAVLLTPDLGLAYTVPVGGAALLFRGGASGVFGFSTGGATALPGFHGGVSVLVPVIPGLGLRLDGLYRGYLGLPDARRLDTFVVAIGITSLPR